jgi:hypothetical protein
MASLAITNYSRALTGHQLLVTATADGNSLCSLRTDLTERTISKSSFIIECLLVVMETCLSSHYQAMAGFISHHVTICIFNVRDSQLMHNFHTNVTKVKWHYGNTVCGTLITFSATIMHQSNSIKGNFCPYVH